MKTVYIVVDNSIDAGVETFLFNGKEDAKKCYASLLNGYESQLGGLGSGERNECWAEIVDDMDNEVARVFWNAETVN